MPVRNPLAQITDILNTAGAPPAKPAPVAPPAPAPPPFEMLPPVMTPAPGGDIELPIDAPSIRALLNQIAGATKPGAAPPPAAPRPPARR